MTFAPIDFMHSCLHSFEEHVWYFIVICFFLGSSYSALGHCVSYHTLQSIDEKESILRFQWADVLDPQCASVRPPHLFLVNI